MDNPIFTSENLYKAKIKLKSYGKMIVRNMHKNILVIFLLFKTQYFGIYISTLLKRSFKSTITFSKKNARVTNYFSNC